MSKKYYILLGVLLVIFFGFNLHVYTRSFNVLVSGIKTVRIIPKKYPSILNFGDVMFDRGVRNIIENRGRDPFEYIKRDKDLIKNFDIVVANLEGPIVEMDRSKCQQKAYNFQFSSTTPELLKSAGINMVNIANNHSYDCYRDGYDSTKQYLEKAGIDYMEGSELEKSYVVKNVDGRRMAFVGIDESVQRISVSSFYPLVKRLDTENDFVIVNIHWGTEYELNVTDTQTVIAHNLIDNGADVIFGSHPHVIEPVEIYKNKVTFYSLGNFVFDQNFGDTMVGLGAGVEFREEKSIFTIFPFNIKLFAPEFMTGAERDVFCDRYLFGLNHAGCSFEI